MPDLNAMGKSVLQLILENKIYFLLGTGFLVLLAGVMILIFKARKRKTVLLSLPDPGDKLVREEEKKVGLEEIQKQLARLIKLGEEIRDLLVQMEKKQEQIGKFQSEEQLFTSLDDRIYQAHQKGLGLAELAAEFGRPKGEVELILNLYRKKLREGDGQ